MAEQSFSLSIPKKICSIPTLSLLKRSASSLLLTITFLTFELSFASIYFGFYLSIAMPFALRKALLFIHNTFFDEQIKQNIVLRLSVSSKFFKQPTMQRTLLISTITTHLLSFAPKYYLFKITLFFSFYKGLYFLIFNTFLLVDKYNNIHNRLRHPQYIL